MNRKGSSNIVITYVAVFLILLSTYLDNKTIKKREQVIQSRNDSIKVLNDSLTYYRGVLHGKTLQK